MENFSSGLKNAGRAVLAAGLLSLGACNPDDPMTDCKDMSYKRSIDVSLYDCAN